MTSVIIFLSFLILILLLKQYSTEQIEAFSDNCPRINRSRPIESAIVQGTDDQIICKQDAQIKDYQKQIKKMLRARDQACEQGQLRFHNPLSRYQAPLMDPTLAADKQPVTKGIELDQIINYGTCTLDAYDNLVCNPKLYTQTNSGWQPSRFNIMDLLSNKTEFILLKNNIGPNK